MFKANNQPDDREPESYSESEAVNLLGISIARLHQLLDEHFFNDGTKRPRDLKLRYADLVLLAFWEKSTESPKVIRMPRRN